SPYTTLFRSTSYFRIAFGEGQDCNFDFNFSGFCTQYNLHSEKTYNTLQLLDRLSIIKLSQQFRKEISLQFIVPNSQLFPYLEENKNLDLVVKAILRTYGGIFENRMPINVSSLANKTGINEKDILEILKKLHSDKIIDLDQKKHDASIIFLVPREDEAGIYPYSPYITQQSKNKTDK